MVTFLKRLCLNLIVTSYKPSRRQLFDKLSDEELVASIVKNNDSMQFGILYDRFSERVYNKCLGFARDSDEAKDLAQDVFLKLFVKLASFKGTSKFSTWLYAFTYNHCVNFVNRNTAKKIEKKSVSADEIKDEIDDVEDESLMSLKAEKLKVALEQMEPEEKMILLMKYQDAVSIKEIAGVLNLGESAVKMRLKRAKEKLVTVYEN
jgi:RNA polymerase sigma-70 factor (ECF subfamily)